MMGGGWEEVFRCFLTPILYPSSVILNDENAVFLI